MPSEREYAIPKGDLMKAAAGVGFVGSIVQAVCEIGMVRWKGSMKCREIHQLKGDVESFPSPRMASTTGGE